VNKYIIFESDKLTFNFVKLENIITGELENGKIKPFVILTFYGFP
jgi:hypothetical protein